MSTFILLSRLTADGGRRIHAHPERINEVNEEIGEFGCRVLMQYATLGRYDFLTVIEAPDEATVAHMVVGLSSRGTVKIEVMSAIERADYLARLKMPKQIGKLAT